MNWLRKCLGRAKISTSKRQRSGDNEHKSVDFKCDSQSVEYHYIDDPVNEYMVKMLNLIKEFLIFCLVFIAYAAITNDPPKVSKAPAAYPFFAKDLPVKDFYRGQIITAIEHSRMSDLSFIMFYAPWDAESQAARKEFLIAAEYLKHFVKFAAVNCWQPGSECRNQYSKVYRWPVLIVYPSFGSGIQYNGPLIATHMMSFLQKIMQPIRRIANQTDFNFEEAFIVAEINPLPGNVEYPIFYTTALKYLEADYNGRVTFYVKPVKVTQNTLSLYLWNQVRILELEEGGWKVDTILQWIIKTSESPSSWVMPTGSKSLVLAEALQPGPTLILFTPKNPLRAHTDYYMMLQEIAQEYKNCDNWGLSFDMKTKRLNNKLEYEKLKKMCQVKTSKPRAAISITASSQFLNSTSNIKGKVELDCEGLGVKMCHSVRLGQCLDTLPLDEENDGFIETSIWKSDSDPKSMENLKKATKKTKCKNFLKAQQIHSAIFEPKIHTEKIDVSNLACENSNGSLNFIAMDSLMYYMFAERLGLDLFAKNDTSAVVILNEKSETHYVMQEPITSYNVRMFIRDYTNNTLRRSSDSIVNVPTVNTPSYPIKLRTSNAPIIFLEELNSKNYLSMVLQEKRTVLVMYYSKQCSYCNGISYIFLTVARKLSFVENIKFARINGDENILPWEYTMEEFPTILFFPATMKEETRVFPADIPITVPNLLGFILSNLDISTKLHVMYSVCLHSQLQKDKDLCLANIRNETISLIEKTLKDWRKSNNRQRRRVLHNLKQLRQLQFLFSHSPEEHLVIESYFKKLKVNLTDDYSVNSTSRIIKDEL
ncbi:unnamed protein product [Ceutorhynchus assimilis]|uniref:Thioredoxin domain-containing protein n=1 Tax=Ceutorhynchus assimilis TaxID=467358 RepID=A0A9N9N3K1_9CUCU|nr:unnamed protein product [Ceutorhynchus assimilis]